MDTEQIAGLIAKPYRHLPEFGYDFPTGLLLAWLACGRVTQLAFDLETDRGADDWTFWWLRGGRKNFPGISDELDREILQKLHVQHLTPKPRAERLQLTPLLSLIHRHRDDLRDLFDVDTATGCDQMWYWWLSFGVQEYFGSPPWLIAAQVKALHRLDASFFRKTGLVRPTAMVMVAWNNNPANRQRIDIETASGSSILWQSFLASEAKTFRLPNRGLPHISDTISQTQSDFSDPLKGLIPPNLAILRLSRPDLRAAFEYSERGISDLVFWWLTHGRGEFADLRPQIDQALLRSLHLDFLPAAGSGAARRLTPLLGIIHGHRPDLHSTFDVATPDGITGMWRWWLEYGERETFGTHTQKPAQMPSQANIHGGFAAAPARSWVDNDRPSIAPASPPTRAGKSGVCLVGHAKGEFGLGEDVRLLRAALDQANVANFVVKAPWHITARESIDEPALDAADAGFDSDVIFYAMPPFDTVMLLNKIGSRAFSARRKIGFWQWELERFPAPANLAMALVDEIWCHSEHAATAFRQATDKPVIKVPLPVSVPDTGIASRAAFGLPEQAFVVFTSFDGASAIARKNPLAAILAFQRAFPADGSVDARLIVKAMNTDNDSLWRECLRKAAADERIVIIDTVLDRDAYYRLLRACDAVISLHRAEGFGRLMAEAMAFGIPVIASGYSGNLDFMTEENSWLIDGDLIPVLPGDYAFHQGQRWLEPDVEKAARALRECATDDGKCRQRVALGITDIASKYSLKTCGEAYAKLLDMDSMEVRLTARRQCASV
ncbi:MAG: glycosyltransferase [Bradyrhizobium sp.]|uniref:glycosyltransferase n=1 Tax=Bradyrhizobium sp. TaxID=376 RepID=UPI001221B9BA|nr:glycosyltransferase [Bradyrhizobium sp.]THD73087.1 MAG: glycosyltransferase [Bradyrhizobium sp.]